MDMNRTRDLLLLASLTLALVSLSPAIAEDAAAPPGKVYVIRARVATENVAVWSRAVQKTVEAHSNHEQGNVWAAYENVTGGPDSEYVFLFPFEKFADLDGWVRERVATLPDERRVLVTAHDAFSYFGRAYDMEVRGLLGVSTAAEAGTADVQALAAFIADRGLPAVFVESSVPPRFVEALTEAVLARGGDVTIGGSLYSDALGSPGGPAETYVGTVRANVETIVGALSGSDQ